MNLRSSFITAIGFLLASALALCPGPAFATEKGGLLLAESGIILRDSGDWKVIRTPDGRVIRKPKSRAGKAEPKKQAPKIIQAAPPAGDEQREKPAAKRSVTRQSDRRIIFGAGAQYNPLNKSVGPILVARPLEGLGLALWHGSGEYNLSEFRVFGYSYIVPGLLLGHAGAGYLHSEEETASVNDDIEAKGGSVFGGLAIEISRRVHITAEAYAARVEKKQRVGGILVEAVHGVIGASAGMVVYIW